MIKHFELNTDGRDFVVGDTHGCFSKLRNKLHEMGFDTKKDRLLRVGDLVDLVDRGPESEQCISFLQKPWFHAIRGNHEQMAIEFYNDRWPEWNYVQNGGKWFTDMSSTKRWEYIKFFQELPFVIEVETKSGLVGIIHTECVVPTWEQFKEGLLNEYSTNTYQEMCMWGKRPN